MYTSTMPTYKNPTEAAAGLTSAFGNNLTPAQQQAINNAAALVPTTPVDASSLGKNSSLNLSNAPTPTTPNIKNIEVTQAATPTPTAPVQATTITDKLSGLVAKITGKEADKAQAIETETSPYRKQLNELNTQIKLHKADSIAREEAAMNRVGGTTYSNAVATQQQQRTDAIEGLKLAAFAEAMQGNISLAENHAKTAVDAKYAEMQQELETTKNNIYNNWDTFTAAEKKRASATLLQIDKDDAIVAQQKEDDKAILNIGMKLSEYGVDMKTVQSVLESGNVKKALTLASSKLQDPKAKMELESLRLDQILKKAQIAKMNRETSLLGEPTKEEAKATAAALKEAKASIPVMQDKIDAVDTLLESSGMNSRVGTNFLSRTPQGQGIIGKTMAGVGTLLKVPLTLGFGTAGDIADSTTGAGQNFAGGVHKLVGGLTLQSLIDAKARGATFGALSEGELNILANSASAINDWEIKDKSGKGTGVWNIDEKSFKKELKTIQDLTRRALIQSKGTLLNDEESALLDDVYDGEQQVAPINYYP